MSADLVTVDDDNRYFFIVAHHLVVDMMSWNPVMRDFEGGFGADGQEVKCSSLLSVSAEVREGRLQMSCSWNRRARGQEDIEAWLGKFERCLVDVARGAAGGHMMRHRVAVAVGMA